MTQKFLSARPGRKLGRRHRKMWLDPATLQTKCILCELPMTKETWGLGRITSMGGWICPGCVAAGA